MSRPPKGMPYRTWVSNFILQTLPRNNLLLANLEEARLANIQEVSDEDEGPLVATMVTKVCTGTVTQSTAPPTCTIRDVEDGDQQEEMLKPMPIPMATAATRVSERLRRNKVASVVGAGRSGFSLATGDADANADGQRNEGIATVASEE
eukprot:6450375-Pyramimonas_sp.AAC.1